MSRTGRYTKRPLAACLSSRGGGLRKGLTLHLLSRRSIRRSRHATRKGHGKGQIADMVSIRQRPSCVESRAEAGHRKGDLLAGSRNSHIATVFG